MNPIPKFIVNEEEGIVICIITECALDAYVEVAKALPKYIHILAYGHDSKHFYINDKYTGKAKCSKDDKFDLVQGQDLAFERAYSKYLRAKYRAANRMRDYLKTGLNSLSKYIDNNKKFERIYKSILE